MVGFSGVKEAVEKRGLDATVGGLVWVQRKNGSWWPGQVVGAEVSETHLTLPRSGTPIMLLGRDDTSVDWYNFETTKVVKPFRCGEYEACIQKAEISAANNSLKITKYPRRENAIVSALEIEKKNMFEDDPESDALLRCEKVSASISHYAKDSEYLSEKNSSEERVGAYEENSNSTQEFSQPGISLEGSNGSTHFRGQYLRGRKQKTLNDSEDDGYDGAKRMKGLNDLGMVPEKKVQILALPSVISQISASFSNLSSASGLFIGTLSNGSPTPAAKRKRSQVLLIHDLPKRSFQRPATKVLENTTMVPVTVICDEFANPFERYDAVSSFYDCENGDKLKDTELFDSQPPEDDFSDTLFDVPFFDEKHPSGLSSSWHSASTKPRINSSRRHSSLNVKVQGSCRDYEVLDESAPSSFSSGYANQIMEKSASKWHSKGKRNARHGSKADDSYSINNADLLECSGWFSPGAIGLLNGSSVCKNRISMSSSPRSFPYDQSRFSGNSNSEMANVSPTSIHSDSALCEVEVTVETTRPQVQPVPYISLTSKLNGKLITGHLIPVEVLEDGYCDLETSDYPASGSCELEVENAEMVLAFKPKAHRVKKDKNGSRNRCKRSKSRKKHSSSKKTRKLSSLTGARKLGLVKSKPMSQSSNGPALACVPLKVVFSRINEALNGSRSVHHSNNT